MVVSGTDDVAVARSLQAIEIRRQLAVRQAFQPDITLLHVRLESLTYSLPDRISLPTTWATLRVESRAVQVRVRRDRFNRHSRTLPLFHRLKLVYGNC